MYTFDQVPAIVQDRDDMKVKIETMDRAAEKEKDERSKQVQDIKTEAASMQENLQEKVSKTGDLSFPYSCMRWSLELSILFSLVVYHLSWWMLQCCICILSCVIFSSIQQLWSMQNQGLPLQSFLQAKVKHKVLIIQLLYWRLLPSLID